MIEMELSMMGNRFACPQRTDNFGGLLKPVLQFIFLGPGQACDVLIERLPSSEREPESIVEHLPERGGGLSDDRRVISDEGAANGADGKRRGLERRP
jgi:hypothetical protein